ncbi:MAG TPA: hypothetical protein VJN29_17060 [Intrasporangium sp.]|uniref:hypothetical protein n=1 Tax=Intrasporangium sp. TaxID=1925024 RepID=UPI002B49A160|nr:hypothetical protein [Intrasporangium sp.]HKX68930.1 hypothetical protein [Intrasporangium sp.]
MRNITMTMNAASCAALTRPRPASILLADVWSGLQGTGVSIVAPAGVRRIADRGVKGSVPFAAGVDLTAIYKTSDVARSRSGRHPV